MSSDAQAKLFAAAIYELRLLLAPYLGSENDAKTDVRLAAHLSYALHNDALQVLEGDGAFDVGAAVERLQAGAKVVGSQYADNHGRLGARIGPARGSGNANIHSAVVEEVALLASASKQLEYEIDVPKADVPAELICRFCDDLYHPKSGEFTSAFSEEELKSLACLYGALAAASQLEASSVQELLKLAEWRTVIAVAKELCVTCRWPV